MSRHQKTMPKVLRLGHNIRCDPAEEDPERLPRVLRLGSNSYVYGIAYEDIGRAPTGTGGGDESNKRAKFGNGSLSVSSTPFVNPDRAQSLETSHALESLSPVRVVKDRLIRCGITKFGICGDTPFFFQPDR
jgi:hypothetical protein